MMELPDYFNSMFEGVYGWTTNGYEAVPPIHDFPLEVKERADYFGEMAEGGMTFLRMLDCIFSEEKPRGYDTAASKPWLPMTKGFKEWAGNLHSLAQMEIAVYLLYGQSESVEVE